MNVDAPRPATLRLLASAAVVLAVVGVIGAVVVSRQSPLERALDVLDDDGRFTRASEAGAAVLDVSMHVKDAAEPCSDDSARCDALNTALGTTQVGAVNLLRCGRPEIVRFRRDLVRYLEALRNDESPDPPPTPRC